MRSLAGSRRLSARRSLPAPGPPSRALRLGLLLGVAVGLASVGLSSARSQTTATCALPGTSPLWVDYGEGSVPPAVRDVLARPGVVIAASGKALPSDYRRKGAATLHFERKLPTLVGTPGAPADPATIQVEADALFDRAVTSTACETPTIALNELFGAGLTTPWSASNATYRANVLALVRRLAERGAKPVLLVPGNPNLAGEAGQWWRDVSAVANIVYEAYYNAVVLDRLGRIVGPRRVRLGMRSVVRTFTEGGVPVERLGFMLGFQVAVGFSGREGLEPSSHWFRVVKWEALAAQQLATDTGITSIWSWGWGTFGPESTDPDKPAAACVYLWSRDSKLCDAKTATAPDGFDMNRAEGAIVLPEGVVCVTAAGKLRETSVAALARVLGSREAALTALFARRALIARVPIERGAILSFEQRIVDTAFAGDRAAYLAELERRRASLAVARGVLGDELRRRAIGALAGSAATVLEWSATVASDESDTATCAKDELPGTGDFPRSNKRDIGFVPLAAKLPRLLGDRVPPTAPTGVSVAPATGGNTLTWTGGREPDLAGFLVFRAAGAGAPFERITELPYPWTTYIDRRAPAGSAPVYAVRAIDASGNTSTQVVAVETGSPTP